MDKSAALKELAALGTAQNRKVYARHGVGEDMYGVSFGNLKALKKKIKVDHNLAQLLWETGNHDARVLATMIADPKQVDELLLDCWCKALDNYVITDSFVGFVAKTTFAHAKAVAWLHAREEYTARAGWHLLSHLAQKDQTLPDDFFEPYLTIINNAIHSQPNRTREAMNNTLIAIGIRNAPLQKKALVIAESIGKVAVDHGQTSCKTPNAAEYINKTVERKKKKGQWRP